MFLLAVLLMPYLTVISGRTVGYLNGKAQAIENST